MEELKKLNEDRIALKDRKYVLEDEGDVVIDPCAGSGSTLIAAANKKRKGFGFEIKKDFYTQAKEWEEEIITYNKELDVLGFGKTLMEKSSLTLWS